MDRTGVNPLRDFRLLLQLIWLIRAVRPTIVHTVTIKPVLYGGIAARLLKVPSLVSAVSGLGLVFMAGTDDLLVRPVRGLYRLALGHTNSYAIFQNPDDFRHMVDARLVSTRATALIRGSGVDMSAFKPSPPPPGPPIVDPAGALGLGQGRGRVRRSRAPVATQTAWRSGWRWSGSRRSNIGRALRKL